MELNVWVMAELQAEVRPSPTESQQHTAHHNDPGSSVCQEIMERCSGEKVRKEQPHERLPLSGLKRVFKPCPCRMSTPAPRTAASSALCRFCVRSPRAPLRHSWLAHGEGAANWRQGLTARTVQSDVMGGGGRQFVNTSKISHKGPNVHQLNIKWSK